METVSGFILGGSKITANDDRSHEIKGHLLLGRKVMTNEDSIFKSRDIPLPTKVHLVKAMVFPVVMYGCESWTVKKAECHRIDVFELWCWRRLLRVPWTARRCNQSILKEIGPGILATSFEDLTLKSLMLGGIENRRRRGQQRMRLVGWHHQHNGHGFGWTLVMNREAWHAVVHGVTKSWTRLSD